MNVELESKLFELSDLLRFFMEEGYSVQDMGTGHGLQVVPTDHFAKNESSFHVYPSQIMKSVPRPKEFH
jgi:hypothetical protein